MYEFAGFTSLEKDVSKDKTILEKMNIKLKKQFVDSEEYSLDKNIGLACRFINKSIKELKIENEKYKILFIGKIYNRQELYKKLNFKIEDNSDEELLINLYIKFGTNMLEKINGIFSLVLWDDNKKRLLLARDRFGIKSLYYTIINNTIIFSSEIKAILEYPDVENIVDNTGFGELIGLRPSTYSRNYSF